MNPRPAASCPAHGRRATGRWRYGGLAAGLGLGFAAIWAFSSPDWGAFAAPGPNNTGHTNLACRECHTPAPGNAIRQASSQIYHRLGLRRTALEFGARRVGAAECLACHEREDDHHPVSRFFEPRFSEARRALTAHRCAGCHLEHRGERVTLSTIGFCDSCHRNLELASDPIRPTHAEMVEADSWNTCLRCHDFHGSHRWTVPDRLAAAPDEREVRAYFAGAPSPYGEVREDRRALETRYPQRGGAQPPVSRRPGHRGSP